MPENTTPPRSLRDYSLVGPKTALAIEKGLADARWYSSPVARDQMLALLERRDGPAIRDTLIWFGLLFAFGLAGLALLGYRVLRTAFAERGGLPAG